ncbi:hypothetical protein H0H93_008696 [Arthromyces matolae]|nr:hypothetical protein H0H93_008696 [Arthromyces matolae]
MSLDAVLNQITTSNNADALNSYLKSNLSKDTRDTILASLLSSGQDPLTVLDMRQNTLGVLWILAARLSIPTVTPPNWQLVQEFCHTFIPEEARLAPDREIPITNIDTTLSPDLTYNDSLTYHYLGGIAFAALKRWSLAEDFFEIALSTPGTPSAIQLEALKKLKLVQLIAKGKTSPLPKYTQSSLPRLFKNTPYNAFVNAYPHNTQLLNDCAHREATLFANEKNVGLIQQALARAPRWTLKKLTATYVTLSLSDIAKAIRIESEDEVRELLLDMIESNDVAAQISADGTVTFSDPAPTFTKEQVDHVLANVQNQAEHLKYLEREVSKSKEYLSKAVKNRDEAWPQQTDEDLFSMAGGGGSWADDATFA